MSQTRKRTTGASTDNQQGRESDSVDHDAVQKLFNEGKVDIAASIEQFEGELTKLRGNLQQMDQRLLVLNSESQTWKTLKEARDDLEESIKKLETDLSELRKQNAISFALSLVLFAVLAVVAIWTGVDAQMEAWFTKNLGGGGQR